MNPSDLLALTTGLDMPLFTSPSGGWSVRDMFRAMRASRSLRLAYAPAPVYVNGMPF